MPLLDIEGSALTLHRAWADGRIIGRLVEMQLELEYRNDEEVEIEVVHTFPLPWQAVLLGLEVTLGETTLVGLVKAREDARHAYEDAMEEGHRPLLININPDQSYTLELGLLRPGERCTVLLRYAQVLRTDQGSLRWILPTTLAPRYGNTQREGGFEPHAEPRIDPMVEYPFELRLRIEGELAKARMHSPSHAVHLHRDSARCTRLELKERTWLDRDFVLLLEDLPLANHAQVTDDPFAPGMLVVMATLMPTWPMPSTQPVRMKVLVDCSGSMAGDSLQAARAALQQILQSLQAGDTFSLSRFGSEVEHQSPALRPVSARTRALGQCWVETLEADLGGTEMRAALLSTLSIRHDAGPVDVLLITDGLIHATDDILQAAKHLQQRLFIVGIGSSVAEGVLRRLAEQSGGSCEFVAPGEDATAAILRLFRRMRAPRLEVSRLQWPAGLAVQGINGLPPSLFAGDEVSVFAHLRADDVGVLKEGEVRLWGRVEGVLEDVLLATARLDAIQDETGTLSRLAAYRRYLEGQEATTQEDSALATELLALAERYQLITADTALVLVQHLAEETRAQAMPELRRIPQMLAAGWGGYGSVRSSTSALDLSKIDTPIFLRRVADSGPPLPKADRLHDVLTVVIQGSQRGLRHLWKYINTRRVRHPERNALFWVTTERADLQQEKALTPAGFVEWLRLNSRRCPVDYASLKRTGLPKVVIDWLRLELGYAYEETEVINAFVRIMAAHPFTDEQQADPTLRHFVQSLAAPNDLLEALHEALRAMTASAWPMGNLSAASQARASTSYRERKGGCQPCP